MSENFEKAITTLRGQVDSKIASYLSSCVNCGQCADACLFYTETGDARYTPIYKVEPMRRLWQREQTVAGKIGKALGFGRDLTEADFAEWQEMTYNSCTLCGRCSMVCPVGNDIAYMIRKQREAFAAAGYTPPGLQAASTRALEIGSPMGVTWKALSAQIGHAERATGLKIPVDVQGADYMALFSSMEIMNFPEYIEALARIFDAAGVSWTVSSKAFEATNSGIQIGSSEIARELVSRVVDAAEGLGCKYVISPECGHAYTAIRWDGPNLIGRPYEFEVVHILELLDQLRKEGRLQPAEHGGAELRGDARPRQDELVLRWRRRPERQRGRARAAHHGVQGQEAPARGDRRRDHDHRVRQLPHRHGRSARALRDAGRDRGRHRAARRPPQAEGGPDRKDRGRHRVKLGLAPGKNS